MTFMPTSLDQGAPRHATRSPKTYGLVIKNKLLIISQNKNDISTSLGCQGASRHSEKKIAKKRYTLIMYCILSVLICIIIRTTRPAGRVKIFMKYRGSSRVGPGGVRNLTGRGGSGWVGSDQEVFKSHGSP